MLQHEKEYDLQYDPQHMHDPRRQDQMETIALKLSSLRYIKEDDDFQFAENLVDGTPPSIKENQIVDTKVNINKKRKKLDQKQHHKESSKRITRSGQRFEDPASGELAKLSQKKD